MRIVLPLNRIVLDRLAEGATMLLELSPAFREQESLT